MDEFYDGWELPAPDSKHEDVLIDFLYSDHKLYCLWGSVSSGKTVTSAEAWVGLVRTCPKNHPLAMIGKTELTLEANVLDPLTDFLGSKRCYKKGNVAWIYGHKVRLYGANDAKARSKIQGKSLYAWYGDEVTTWPEEFFMMALSRLRVGKAKAIMTMNPEGPYHYFHKQVIERAADPTIRAKLYLFTMDDNPYLPQDYKDWISSMYVPGTVWHKRWIKGEWAAAEGMIFPFFTDDAKDGYVIDDLPRDLGHWIVPMDYGQIHPTVMGLMGYSPSRQQWVLVKEYYTSNKTVPEYSKEFGDEFLRFNGADITLEAIDIDTGGGGLALLNQIRADYPNIDQSGATSYAIKVDVMAELKAMAAAFYTHKFAIYRGCKRVIQEFYNYVFDDKAKNRGKEEPLKINDDGIDMCRYGWNRAERTPV